MDPPQAKLQIQRIFNKNLSRFLVEFNKLVLKFAWKSKEPRLSKALGRKIRKRDLLFQISRCYFVFCLFVFLRKISPEVTTASPPLFSEEAWPWANIVPIFLYFICGTPTTAWHAKQFHVRIWDPNQQTSGRWEAERANLTTAPQG